MRVLLVGYLYRPHLGPRAFRWAAIAEDWARAGHEVHVVAGWQPSWPREEVLDGVCVHRAGGALVERLRGLLVGGSAPSAAGPPTQHGPMPSQRPSLARRFARLVHDVGWKPWYWPDYATLWRRPALRWIERQLDLRTFDALVSVSIPFSSHLVGERLRLRWPHLRWLCDVGDPFCFLDQTPPNNPTLYARRNLAAERRVFDRADAIAVTTEQTAAEYTRRIPSARDKLHVIGPLAPASTTAELANSQRDSSTAPGPLKLVFVGTLYRSIRGPGYLLALWQSLRAAIAERPVELHFYGHVHDCRGEFAPYAQWLDRGLYLHGPVPREQALAAMHAADVLVNIGNSTRYQLPSKVVEYAATGKPVLNFVTGDDDSSAVFFRTYPAALNVRENRNEPIEHQAQRVARFVLSPASCSARQVADLLLPYRLEAISAAYQRLLMPPASPIAPGPAADFRRSDDAHAVTARPIRGAGRAASYLQRL